MIRLYPLLIWVAGVATCLLLVTSDYVFADRPFRPWLKSAALSFVWPLALMSAPGRNLLLKSWRKL